ncbi:SulP family inorganic anion transporter [Pseudomonas sp. GOM6]|uniref:SulP family inorganic anion transporter n=1 Tax=Pseudomonas sp. GOM6 TaxID=3036944 RepID=UPI002409F988|nr:SulP family inorganic anion transporter [Pseudomonas sp. GOM6]MDG1580395.1 SulP family inorganic anion transporter [Pseudomonas sp. GOM6]
MPNWWRHYHRDMLGGDLGAGVVVALMLLPQGMAYALVAGLPAVVGLYASILPALAYALVGSSASLSVGPMALTSLMTAQAVAELAPVTGLTAVELAAQLALLCGAVLLLCAVLRLGFLCALLSRPVLGGFTGGVALLVVTGQVETLLGSTASSTALGVGTLLALYGARLCLPPRWGRLAPALVLALATCLVAWGNLQQSGVQVLGAIPAGLPPLGLSLQPSLWPELLPSALLLAFVIFVSGHSSAMVLAQRRGERVDDGRELLGQGLANLVSAVSSGFPVAGGLSRSALNHVAGARSQLAGVITALLLGLALLLPTGWLSLLPLPALAATIIFAVLGMLDLNGLRQAWRYDPRDAGVWLATLLSVVTLGVEEGVLVGVLLSLAGHLARSSRPHIAVLGRMADGESFRNVRRHVVETREHLLLLRIDASLFFGNATAIAGRVDAMLTPAVRELVLDMSAVNGVDFSALFALGELNATLARRGVRLHLAAVKGPILDRLCRSSLLDELDGQLFATTAEAYRCLCSAELAE